MADHTIAMPSQTKRVDSTKKTSSVCGGILRILVTGFSFLALILGSIGSPNDLDSYDSNYVGQGDQNQNGFHDSRQYYGYGLGYIVEPLNKAYIASIIISFLLLLSFLPFLFLAGTRNFALKVNRFFYLFIGIFLCIGIICGGIGMFRFWEGCCNVVLPNPNPAPEDGSVANSIQYVRSLYFPQYANHLESPNWCRCNYVVKKSDVAVYSHEIGFKYTFATKEYLKNHVIQSAEPHDFAVHGVSLGMAFMAAILSFLATCIV